LFTFTDITTPRLLSTTHAARAGWIFNALREVFGVTKVLFFAQDRGHKKGTKKLFFLRFFSLLRCSDLCSPLCFLNLGNHDNQQLNLSLFLGQNT
jgi:hypothetical protein